MFELQGPNENNALSLPFLMLLAGFNHVLFLSRLLKLFELQSWVQPLGRGS